MRGLSIFRQFVSDRKANIAILFGLAFIPMVGAMAVAVDYSLANEGRTQAQAALDNTALILSKMMPLSQEDLNTKGRKIFLANLGPNPLSLNASNIADQLVITPSLGKLSLHLNTTYHIRMASVLDKAMPLDIPIATSTDVVWGLGKVEVALALDNTGSMDSAGKLTQLIVAAHKLVEILKNAAREPGDAKVAIIPFGFQVKADPAANVAAEWLRWDLWDDNNGKCTNSNAKTRSTCGSCSVSGGSSESTCTSKGTCSQSWQTSQKSCERNGGTWTTASWTPGSWTPNDHSTWNGCIADRDKDPGVNYDVNDAAVSTSDIATKFPAAQECGSLATAMALSENWGDESSIDPATLHGKINQMIAVGNTNVTIGLDWGFQMVSPNGTLPFAKGQPYGTDNLTKYVIILTDGDNTQNRWVKNDSSPIDARTAAACVNIKARGIKIYSIRVIDGNADLLRNCASDPSMYYEVSDATQLVSVFDAIGSTIANLHLAK